MGSTEFVWEPTEHNEKRARIGWATGRNHAGNNYEGADDAALDLIVDVLHWVASEGHDPDALLERVIDWFSTERKGNE